MRTEFLCISVLRVASGPRVKLASCKSALNPPVVYSTDRSKKGKRKVQGVSQSQTAAFPRHQEEEETDKSKQAQINQTYEKH